MILLNWKEISSPDALLIKRSGMYFEDRSRVVLVLLHTPRESGSGPRFSPDGPSFPLK